MKFYQRKLKGIAYPKEGCFTISSYDAHVLWHYHSISNKIGLRIIL